MKKVKSCSETWEAGKGTRRGPWGWFFFFFFFLRKPGLLLQLPVLGENELWSLLTQVVGSRDLPSPSLADAYPSHSDSLCSLPLPSGSQGMCSTVVIVSLARWVRPGHPSGQSRNQDSLASPGLAAVVSSPPMDCSPPGSSVHRILQARIWEWVATFSSRGSSRPRD